LHYDVRALPVGLPFGPVQRITIATGDHTRKTRGATLSQRHARRRWRIR
jgi:hypothetical protein